MTAILGDWALRAASGMDPKPPRPWWSQRRPEQTPPVGDDWLTWLFLAGRGSGKTRSAAEVICEWAEDYPGCRIALVARTPADCRDVMIEGESGILACSPESFRPLYEPSKRRLTWPNDSQASAYSAEAPAALRGPQHHFAWADESAAWSDARKGDVVDTAWNNLLLGLRLTIHGSQPKVLVTTTPKSNRLTRDMLGRHSTVVSRATTYDNLDNLAPAFREQVLATYEGTRIGRQELMGELLDDVEGALWTLAMIDDHRVDTAPDLIRVVTGVDPSGSSDDGDEQGIVVAGLGVDGEFYVLADRSCRLSPHGWATRAVTAHYEFSGDRIVAEKNFGGEMVASTIRQVDRRVPVKLVSASRGKAVRAEPIAALYEQGKVHHVGAAIGFAKLEDQLTQWTPFDGGSPDRLDALVWALTELAYGSGQGRAFLEHHRRQQEAAAATDTPDAAGPEHEPTPPRQRATNWREIAEQVRAQRQGMPRTRDEGMGR